MNSTFLTDFQKGGEKIFIAQSNSLDVFLRGDEVDIDVKFFPDGYLMVELDSRPSVEGWETRNIQWNTHYIYGYSFVFGWISPSKGENVFPDPHDPHDPLGLMFI